MLMEILKGYFNIFASPQMLIIIAVTVVFFVKNIREAGLRRIVLGESEDSPLVLTFYQMIFGFAGGLMVTLLAGMLGIAFESYLEVQMIFMLTVFSATRFSEYVNIGINVLAVFVVVFLSEKQVIPAMDLINLYLLVGISLVVHGLVLLADRRRGFIPVLFSRQSSIRGGFRMNKTYLIPSAVGFFAASGSILGMSVFYLALIHLFSVKETVMTFSKKQAVSLVSALKILMGTLILVVAYLISFNMELTYLLIPLAPFLIYMEKYIFRSLEMRRDPLFVSDEESIMVLEVRENTPAYRSGLRSGNRIISLDGKERPTYKSLLSFMGTLHYERGVSLMVKDEHDEEKLVEFMIQPDTSTGIIIVPPSGEMIFPMENKA